MKKFKNSFLFFCLIVFYLYGAKTYSQQDLDSLNVYFELSKNRDTIDLKLKHISKTISIAKKYKRDEMLLNGYNRKSYLFGKIEAYDSAIVYGKLLQERSLLTKNNTMLGLSYKKLATYYRLSDSISQSSKFYKKYYEISIINKDTLAQIRALRRIAIYEKDFGSTYESENTATKALILADQLKINDKLIRIKLALNNHIGMLYKERGDYFKALKLYEKALDKATNPEHINTILTNKANIFLEQKKFELAIDEYTKIYNSLKSDKTKPFTRALSNLGIAQGKINNPKGLENINKALEIRIKENNISGSYRSYIHLAEYYKDRNDTKKISFYSNEAYKIAKDLKSSKFILEALSFSVDISDDKKAIEYKKLNDSLAKVERSNTNKFANQKYDFTEKEKIAKAKQSEERFYKLLYLIIGALLFFALIFTIVTLNRKNKRGKQQQAYETETRISQKVHDEVANDVFGIMTKLQINESQNIEILDDLERVYFKTRDISKENSIINFKDDFATILQDLLVSYGDSEVNVITRNLKEVDWHSLSKLKKTVIYRVLQELMTNMKKHSKASIAIISFAKKSKKINIDYKDNGIGCVLKKNVGLQIAETRIKSIKGSLTFESQTNKGFEVKIKI